ncbi:arylsulfatase [Maribacter polysiphoniae]|uniref:Arylsulfatase n=1 Tax=Maribacter polysiphoniae TaxID=429344 RepID=A0A316EH72_9FLAO|nr:arylsulfatase [Maribacter polysiphoniae]MBD1261961.1 arylsulfatase [Maribacter polysiphoniae]PWK22330.1 arylsulfatase A-like enzyme [Maribacter polysiphoniae]
MKIKTIYLLPILFAIVFVACKNPKKTSENTATSRIEGKDVKQPNIIYIIADDLGYGDLGCFGQKKFSTSNIDKLASEGMVFTQHYAGTSVCAPSRCSLMTGFNTGHTVVRGNKELEPEGQYPIPDSTYTVAEALKKVGYVTGAFGKWGLGHPGSEGDPTQQGFDVFYGYNCQRQAHHYYPDHLWSNSDSIVLSGNENGKREIYAPSLIQEKTLQFIEKNKDNPFFLFVPSVIPHAELAAPEDLIKEYSGKFPPEKPYKGGYYGAQATPHAAFVAMIELLDRQVGEIVQKVEDMGISDNTIIIFTSDNGPHNEGGADPEYFDSNGPLRGIKRDLYEGGIRIPMIAKWPGKIKSNSKTELVSAFWDVLPTFSDIAGVDTPPNIDGISFLPTMLGKKDKQVKHEYLYWEFHEMGGRKAIRMGDWKAVRNNVFKNPNAPMELYDLKNDIGENNDIAGSHPDIVKEMEDIFNTARTPSEVFNFDKH